MTGYFLSTHVFAEIGKAMPKAREDFARLIERSAGELARGGWWDFSNR